MMSNSAVRLGFSAVCFLVLSGVLAAQKKPHMVSSAEQVHALLKAGRVGPGDTIVWRNGEYRDQDLNLAGVHGAPGKPLTLRAETSGGVVLLGKSRFSIGVNWWVVQGFHFAGRPGIHNSYNTIQFRSRGGVGATHVALSDTALTNLTVEGASSKWVQIYGRHNLVSSCHFSGKNSKGALLTIELGDLEVEQSAEHGIGFCYFGDIAPQPGSDNEAIRVGFSGDQDTPARCKVFQNYFVRCDGENEIISNKSSYNEYLRNTFRQCSGALVLRHGYQARVEGNFFFGDGAANSGGVRIIDSDHVVVNNYMEGLSGRTWNAAISVLGGKKQSGGTSNGYQAVDNILVAHNTVVNCARSLFFNRAKGKRGPSGRFVNNVFSSQAGPLITADLPLGKVQWAGNLAWGAKVGVEGAARLLDPGITRRGGLLLPDPKGPVVGAGVAVRDAKADITGQQRPDQRDLGAHQLVGASGPVLYGVRELATVGVSFVDGLGPRKLPPAPAKPTQRVSVSHPSKVPAQALDLATWKLTLPVPDPKAGGARELRGTELISFVDREHFFVRRDGAGIVFRAPCGGVTTSGSGYPRTELREMKAGGRKASWGTGDGGVHRMSLRAAITALPPVKRHVVCAQIHDAADDLIAIRLEKKRLVIDRKKGRDVVLDADYRLGTLFDLVIEVADGHVRVGYNGARKMDWTVGRRGCYFKAGCYTQSNPKKGDDPESYGEVLISALKVEHL